MTIPSFSSAAPTFLNATTTLQHNPRLVVWIVFGVLALLLAVILSLQHSASAIIATYVALAVLLLLPFGLVQRWLPSLQSGTFFVIAFIVLVALIWFVLRPLLRGVEGSRLTGIILGVLSAGLFVSALLKFVPDAFIAGLSARQVFLFLSAEMRLLWLVAPLAGLLLFLRKG